MSAVPAETKPTLEIIRMLKAPRALVWAMFSDPYHLAQWWGPKGYSNRVEVFDFRSGGRWLHVMIGRDGKELPIDSEIVEVVPMERIVFRDAPADPTIFGDNPPPGFIKTLSFAEMNGQTKLTLVCTFETPEQKDAVARRGFMAGTNESFDKLEDHLATQIPGVGSSTLGRGPMGKSIVNAPAGENFFTITRIFDAPRALIFKCYTQPEHIAHFWGPRDARTTTRLDLRVGGVWRTDWDYENGGKFGYSSVYLEIVPPERIVYRDAPSDWTFGTDGLPPVQLHSTITLTESEGRTTVTVHVVCPSVEAHNENINRGFAGMVDTGHDRLAEYLTTLAQEGPM